MSGAFGFWLVKIWETFEVENIISFNYKFQNQQSCEAYLSRTLIQALRHSRHIAWFSSSHQIKLCSSSPQTAQISILRLCMVLR